MVVLMASFVAPGASATRSSLASPLLEMEALSRTLSRAMVGGYPSGFRAGIQNNVLLEISHLFADDTNIMCDAHWDQIYNLGHILLCFEAISSIKVNL
jgi:hypothetical protein